MKVNAFVNVYNSRLKHVGKITPELVANIIKDLIKPISHISYDKKIDIANQVIHDNINAEYPTAMRYRSFIIYLIKAYTNLEIDNDGFDILMNNGLLDLILLTFESEYKMCNTIFQMCVDDYESRRLYG